MKKAQIFGNPSSEPVEGILAEAKLQRITDFNSQDIFVAGYPKSGNTWMQYLLAALRFGIKSSLAPDSLVQDLVPDVHYKRLYRRYLTPTFFKSHHLPQPQFRRVIYLVRDGRDVMVSYFHHLNAINGQADYLQMVLTGEGLFPCPWHEHVEAWLANPHGAEMLIVTYENLQNNTVAELQKICQFAGLECDQGTLECVARETTFEAMRAKEKKSGWENPVWPRDKSFFRRGKVGSFQDEMPKQVLEAFTKISRPTLQRLGYL